MTLSAFKTVERVKAEWESTVDSVEQLICVLHNNGIVVRANKTIEHWGFGQAGLGKVSDVKGKPLHPLMHPSCSNPQCYLKQFIELSNKVITTGEPVDYSGFDAELNRNLLVQMIPVDSSELHGVDHVVMIFLDITQLNLFGLESENKSSWRPALANKALKIQASSITTLHQKQPSALTLPKDSSRQISFKAIEQIKREWESAIDVLPQLICLMNADATIARANRAVESWKLGVVTEVSGRQIHEMLHPNCADEDCYLHGFNRLITDVIATGNGAECQARDTVLNRHLHFQVSTVSSQSLAKSGFAVVLVCDITDVKHAELKIEHLNTKLEKRIEARARHLQQINQKLQEEIEQRKQIEIELTISRQKFSHLVELMNEGMVIQDLDRKVTYANKHLLKMLGLPRSEVVGRDFSDFVDVDFIEAWTGGKLKNVKSVETSYVFKMHGRGNKALWVKGSPQLLYDGDKNCIGSYAVITDINDQIEIEQKLLRTESKLRSLAKQVLYAQELERKRIASELHDGIGQTLSAIKFYVENNISNLGEESAATAIDQFEKVVPKLQGAIEEVRRISMALRPSLLDDIGILATLNWFCRESNLGVQNINYTYNKHNVMEDDISPSLKTEMFRIVQEAVNNASKYSKAKNIQIITKEEDKHLRLEISDDGIGFDYAVTASKQGYAESKGMGLVSMRERVENSGGYFSVDSVLTKGTAIICLWPKGKHSFVDNRSGRTDRRKRL